MKLLSVVIAYLTIVSYDLDVYAVHFLTYYSFSSFIVYDTSFYEFIQARWHCWSKVLGLEVMHL